MYFDANRSVRSVSDTYEKKFFVYNRALAPNRYYLITVLLRDPEKLKMRNLPLSEVRGRKNLLTGFEMCERKRS